MIKKILNEAAIIILAAAVVAVAVNSLRHKGLPLMGPDGTLTQEPTAGSGAEITVKEITIQEAISHFQADSALFADARDANAYNRGHIKGALNLPEEQFDQWIGDFLERTNPSYPIITYCEGYYCVLAKKLATKLIMAGFENVYYLPDGWGNWSKHGMPVETGA